jgi:hypothetical protein
MPDQQSRVLLLLLCVWILDAELLIDFRKYYDNSGENWDEYSVLVRYHTAEFIINVSHSTVLYFHCSSAVNAVRVLPYCILLYSILPKPKVDDWKK